MKQPILLLLYIGCHLAATAQNWNGVQKSVFNERKKGDKLGYAVAMHGNYAIAGAYWDNLDASGNDSMLSAGAAHIFYNNGTEWVWQQKLVAADRSSIDFFGEAVAIYGDYALVAATGDSKNMYGVSDSSYPAGAVYLFKRTGNVWSQTYKITAPKNERWWDDNYGNSIALNQTHVVVGTYKTAYNGSLPPVLLSGPGAAYVYRFSGDTLIYEQPLYA
ncbi:MAG: hypothetical protein IPN22_11645 [Bacteroidetes bacterium]|nr:hypothetical protein [Bacteroidota bacterium]